MVHKLHGFPKTWKLSSSKIKGHAYLFSPHTTLPLALDYNNIYVIVIPCMQRLHQFYQLEPEGES